MNLRKNAAAKLTALAAALFTLAGGFVLVHRNPPASDAAPQPVASTSGPSQPAPASQQAAPNSDAGDDSTSSAQQTAPPVTRMTHTRTHAS